MQSLRKRNNARKTYLSHEKVKEKIGSQFAAAFKCAGKGKISGLQNLEIRFGSWSVGSFCGKGIEVREQLRKTQWMSAHHKK